MTSTKVRSFCKACFWQLSGVLIVFILTRDFQISGLYFGIRLLMYFAHERIWKKIKWGKNGNKRKC